MTQAEFVITAEVHRDDFHYQAEFDAVRWFEQASDDEIIALAEIEWGGDQASDEVARFFEDKNEDVADVLANTACEEGLGFECHVDAGAAETWLKANRPDLYHKLGYN